MYSTCILTDDYLNFNRRKVDIGGCVLCWPIFKGKFYNWSHTLVKHFRLNYDWFLCPLFIQNIFNDLFSIPIQPAAFILYGFIVQ